MKKKNIKVKKGNGDISITIENNLNANNKQINHQQIKRRRRKKKVEDTEEINEVPNIPLKDVSYIKPGPISNFQKWRNNMIPPVVLPPPPPPPPAPAAVPAPPVQPAALPIADVPTWKDFSQMMASQRVQPPESWSYNLIDNNGYTSPRFVELDSSSIRPTYEDFNTALNTLRIEEADKQKIQEQVQNEIKISNQSIEQIVDNLPIENDQKKEIKTELNKTQAKRLGTLHGNKRMAPQGDYKDTIEYQTNYDKAFKNAVDEINKLIIPGSGKTRLQKQENNNVPSWKDFSMLMQSVDKIKNDIYTTPLKTPKPPKAWTYNLIQDDDEDDVNEAFEMPTAATFRNKLDELAAVSETLKKKSKEKREKDDAIEEIEQEQEPEKPPEPEPEPEPTEQEDEDDGITTDEDTRADAKRFQTAAKIQGTKDAKKNKPIGGRFANTDGSYEKAYYIQLGKQDAAQSERPRFDNTDYQEGYEQEIRRLRNPPTKKKKK